jgi:hypothetical protein
MAGIPTRSKHVDGTSRPAGAAETCPLAVAPAVAILENMGTVGVAGKLASCKMVNCSQAERSSITQRLNYAARAAADRDIYSFAFSGNSAVDAMLGALAATPRETAECCRLLQRFQA